MLWHGNFSRMESTSFYSQILGITSPWKTVCVDLEMKAKRIVMAVQHFVCKSGRAHYPMAGISGRGA